MTKNKLFLPFEIYWDTLNLEEPGVAIRIENNTDSNLMLRVNWACDPFEAKPPKIEKGVMKLDLSKGDYIDWAEEAVDWVEPKAWKHFYSDLDCVHKMMSAAAVLSPDLVRFRAIVDDEDYEILSGSELGLWLDENVPLQYRPFLLTEDD